MRQKYFIKQTSVLLETFKMSVQMGVKEYINLLHTGIQWVSRGTMLTRVFEPRGELEDAFKNILHLIQWKISRSPMAAKLSCIADGFPHCLTGLCEVLQKVFYKETGTFKK